MSFFLCFCFCSYFPCSSMYHSVILLGFVVLISSAFISSQKIRILAFFLAFWYAIHFILHNAALRNCSKSRLYVLVGIKFLWIIWCLSFFFKRFFPCISCFLSFWWLIWKFFNYFADFQVFLQFLAHCFVLLISLSIELKPHDCRCFSTKDKSFFCKKAVSFSAIWQKLRNFTQFPNYFSLCSKIEMFVSR